MNDHAQGVVAASAAATSGLSSLIAMAAETLPIVQEIAALVGICAGIYAIRYYRFQMKKKP